MYFSFLTAGLTPHSLSFKYNNLENMKSKTNQNSSNRKINTELPTSQIFPSNGRVMKDRLKEDQCSSKMVMSQREMCPLLPKKNLFEPKSLCQNIPSH
jgi:hypothetical protein